jgi:N-acetyl-anhydromuramyl-L-alanine amidase AmpD
MQILEPAYTWAYKPGYRSETRYVILHHAAGSGSAEAIHAYHRDIRGWCGIAYHYYVRTDGRVYRGRPENWKGGHTTGYNHNSIGICFEGNFETDVMPDAQLSAGRALILDILTRYPSAVIKAHRDLGVTACPGKNFPFDRMMKENQAVATIYQTLNDVPKSYRPTVLKLMEKGALMGRADPDPFLLTDNILDIDETYCRVMTTLDKLGLL